VSSKNLLEMKPGDRGHIHNIEGSRPFIRRLVSLGVTPGAKIHFIRRAPLGDPLQISVSGCHLSIRAHEAGNIKIQQA
jgi:ferrous iron transport protein A